MTGPNQNQPNLDTRYRTMLTLWAAQIMSIGLLLFVALYAGPPAEAQVQVADNRVLGFVFAGIGSFSAIISFAVKSKLLQRSVEIQDPSLVQKALVLACALCEVPALLGVIERFVLPGREFLLLFAISAIAMALHFPRRNSLLAAAYKSQ